MERKEAIEVVKKNYPHCAESGTQFETALRTLIPELCESEDERIRKWIKKELENKYVEDGIIINVLADKAFAWLERQKPSDAALEYLKENHSPSEVSDFQAAMNIAVAKAYDRGRADAIAWLEKQGKKESQGKSALEVWEEMRLEVYAQASGNRHEPNHSDDSTKMFSLTDIDEIFEKIAETQNEYTDPCHTCDHPVLSCNDFPCEEKRAEQKPAAWSEEDEMRVKHLIGFVEKYGLKYYASIDKVIFWLKSLKDRVQPQLTWKPSEEQMEALERCVDYLEESDNEDAEKIESLHNDLKKLEEE